MNAIRVIVWSPDEALPASVKRGLPMNDVTKIENQATGGARGMCGLRSANRMTGSIAGAGVKPIALVASHVIVICAGPANVCAQHCIP